MTTSLVTIGTPVDGKIGPGSSVSIQWDIIGPIPPEDTWVWQVFKPGSEVFAIQQQGSLLGQHEANFRLGLRASPTTSVQNDITLPEGESVSVRAQIRDATGTVVDQEIFAGFTWTFQNEWQLTTQLPVSQGAFTQADRDTIQATQLAVIPQLLLEDGIGSLAFALADLVSNPPASSLCQLETLILEPGVNTLTRPGIAGDVNAYGAFYLFPTVPEDASLTEGGVTEFAERVAQVLVFKRDAIGGQYVSDLVDVHSEGQRIMWGTPFPARVVVTVTPGWTMSWTWLHVCVPGTP